MQNNKTAQKVNGNLYKDIKTNSTPFSSDMDTILSVMEKLLHWAAIIESSDDAIISKSLDGYITSWNKGAQQLYGYSAEEVIGKPVTILMPPERENDFPMIMDKLHKGEKVEHYETKRKKKNGQIIDVSLTVSPIKDSSGTIIGASKIARDITERVEAEKRRDDFVSTTSHELKTPLTSQKIFGELLEKQILKNNDKEYIPYIKKINQQTEKLNKLVNDLLELSRVNTGRLALEEKKFSIDPLIKEIASDLQKTTSHKIVTKCKSKKIVIGDKERIGQVISNLLSNAIKYSPNARKIILSTAVKNESLIITVQDFGIGIDPEFHNKIFERFFRVAGVDEKTYPGMGIGLHFCQEIIHRHGGEIWVKSEKGKGSTFYISLPLKKRKIIKK